MAAIALVSSFGGGLWSPAVAQDESYGGLPPGEGREIVYAVCSGCHSTKLVQQQGMSRDRWDRLLDWMVEKQGMPELDPETRGIVLDYLAEQFGERTRQDGLSPYNSRPQPLMPAE